MGDEGVDAIAAQEALADRAPPAPRSAAMASASGRHLRGEAAEVVDDVLAHLLQPGLDRRGLREAGLDVVDQMADGEQRDVAIERAHALVRLAIDLAERPHELRDLLLDVVLRGVELVPGRLRQLLELVGSDGVAVDERNHHDTRRRQLDRDVLACRIVADPRQDLLAALLEVGHRRVAPLAVAVALERARDLLARRLDEGLHRPRELARATARQARGDRSARLVEVEQVDPVGGSRAACGVLAEQRLDGRLASGAWCAGDQHVVAGPRNTQGELDRRGGAVLVDATRRRRELGRGREAERLRIARPSQLVSAQSCAGHRRGRVWRKPILAGHGHSVASPRSAGIRRRPRPPVDICGVAAGPVLALAGEQQPDHVGVGGLIEVVVALGDRAEPFGRGKAYDVVDLVPARRPSCSPPPARRGRSSAGADGARRAAPRARSPRSPGRRRRRSRCARRAGSPVHTRDRAQRACPPRRPRVEPCARGLRR